MSVKGQPRLRQKQPIPGPSNSIDFNEQDDEHVSSPLYTNPVRISTRLLVYI